MQLPPPFSARTIRGSGRGTALGTPTINVSLEDVPQGIEEGIYACRVMIENVTHDAVAHFGPRPVFKDVPSFEVYLLDVLLPDFPPMITVELLGYLREVRDFSSVEELQRQIQSDIEDARAILGAS